MRVSRLQLGAAAALAFTVLAACASSPPGSAAPQGSAEAIGYAVGPCFGFCPVYSIEVQADGLVAFDGERNTAVLGRRTRRLGPDAYRDFAASLASYRPAAGAVSRTRCEAQASDLSDVRITWTGRDGARAVLEHNKGCRGVANEGLNRALEAAPMQLGVSDWARQVRRSGEAR